MLYFYYDFSKRLSLQTARSGLDQMQQPTHGLLLIGFAKPVKIDCSINQPDTIPAARAILIDKRVTSHVAELCADFNYDEFHIVCYAPVT